MSQGVFTICIPSELIIIIRKPLQSKEIGDFWSLFHSCEIESEITAHYKEN